MWLFDYALYPFVIYRLGLWRGGALMALLSLVICWLTFKVYDWSGRDWLGIEAVKSLKNYAGPSRGRRLLAWTLGRSDFVACVLLSLKFDPFITTAYLRRGAFNGLSRRDWEIFLLSWLIGNAAWALVCFGGVEAVRRIGQ